MSIVVHHHSHSSNDIMFMFVHNVWCYLNYNLYSYIISSGSNSHI
jgi:hypothetical protein